ncbi:hypothetical protein [Janibacter alittae]|uniref:VapC45 PIN like domain-containing protein n=1 Tax=Janibacter alittae TaxID=3115209 RepID=A0ABZ2MM50_9MICO
MARELRARGWTVHLIAEYYDNDGQDVLDEEWISEGTANGWHLLTKDAAIRRRDHEAVAVGDGMLFTLARQNLRALDMVELLERHRNRILRLIAAGEPGIYVIRQSEVTKYTRPR